MPQRLQVIGWLAALLLTPPVARGASASIGIVMSDGALTINNALTAGNATIFEGNTIETGSASARLQLNNGTAIRLSANARGTVYSGRLVLDKGALQIDGSAYEVNSLTLHIVGAHARIGVFGKMVEVLALAAPVRVTNAQGVLLANVQPGKVLDFTPLDDSGSARLAAPSRPRPPA